jgi:hypothetical protein
MRLVGLMLFVALAFLPETSQAQGSANTCAVPEASLHERPLSEAGPSQVSTSLYVLDIGSVSDHAQQFTADFVVELRWQDPRLAAAGRSCRYSLDDVWHPWVQIFNQRNLDERLRRQVVAEPDGIVSYVQRYYGSLGGPLDLRQFPFDQQRLTISLVSFYESGEVKLVFNEELTGRDENASVAGWFIGGGEPSTYEYFTQSRHDKQTTAGFSRLDYTLLANRDIGYYRWKVLLPLTLIVLMSWTVFWIDPSQVGPQLGAAATAMLTLIAFLFSLRGILPPVSYLTRIDYFVYGSLALVFVTNLEGLLTCNLAARGNHRLAKSIDWWSRALFPLLFLALAFWFWR